MTRSRQRNTNSRKDRIPMGVAQLKLTIDSETEARLKAEDLIPRWINDVGQRIQQALNGGYTFVDDIKAPVKTGDSKTEHEQDRRIKLQVGTQKNGSPLFAYLMAIPRDYYEEDQEIKESQNQMVDEAVRGGSLDGVPGHGISPNHGHTAVKNINYRP